MTKQHQPHTPAWFDAMEAQNPHQVAQTRRVIALAGKADVCSVCGDEPAADYQIDPAIAVAGAVSSLRLCDDCLEIRSYAGERFVRF